ncbi:hypothetical protein C7377_1010 [Balneicella halophila]|uniref:Uncharacterized protein n=1 Tax=Balneicella halophila TaxID=1537566 RepID=A0A7L4UP78_BALHA|nr:hypothetical protein [Balneicella halophila]PVX50697.1 hypothetical protein C7377_1010 [Balneicella halophila]
MKRVFSILMLAVLCLGFTACSDDDDDKKVTWPEEISDTHSYTKKLLVAEGAGFDIPLEIKLEDFSNVKDFQDKIRTAEAKAESFIKITGVTEGEHNFETLTLRVKGTNIQLVLTNVDKDMTYNGVKTDLPFLDKVVERLAKQKEITLQIKGTSDKKINEDVVLQLNLSALFKMRK